MDYFQPFSSYIPQQPQQKTKEQQQQDALIEALRGFGNQQQSTASQQAGQVVGANANGSGYGQGALQGAQMGLAGQNAWNRYNSIPGISGNSGFGTSPAIESVAAGF